LTSEANSARPNLARRAPRILLAAAGAALLLWILSSAIVAWKLTHRARPPYAEPLPAWAASAAESVEEVRLATRDGEQLGAWFASSSSPDVSVLLLHGNGGSRSAEANLLRELVAEKITVLAPTLRAHGDSTGRTNDFGWSAQADVIASVAFLEHRIPSTRIVVVGNSLGAAAAIYAARELGHRAAAYVLEAPYRDLRTATRHRLERYLPPPLDRIADAGLRIFGPAMLTARIDDLSPLDRIADVPADVPIVFLSGGADPLAPSSEVEQFRARCSGPTRLVVFPAAAHRDLASIDRGRYVEFLRQVLAEVRRR
jgi:pimeloyl-ACP methyl ester carboxylesterase